MENVIFIHQKRCNTRITSIYTYHSLSFYLSALTSVSLYLTHNLNNHIQFPLLLFNLHFEWNSNILFQLLHDNPFSKFPTIVFWGQTYSNTHTLETSHSWANEWPNATGKKVAPVGIQSFHSYYIYALSHTHTLVWIWNYFSIVCAIF